MSSTSLCNSSIKEVIRWGADNKPLNVIVIVCIVKDNKIMW